MSIINNYFEYLRIGFGENDGAAQKSARGVSIREALDRRHFEGPL